MSEHILMNEEQLIKKAVQVLMKEFGPVEASRFLSIPQRKREDSLKQHETWQKKLNKEAFFNDVFSD
ncbi:MAG: hypothetical protein V3U87_13870 [Methylococcaceae bacterium]